MVDGGDAVRSTGHGAGLGGPQPRRRCGSTTESYYRRDGNYAGATFLDLDPVDPYSFTPADLLSLNLLSVAAQPVAVRRLLEPSRERGYLLRLLSEENLPLDADLAMADADQLLAMADCTVP